MASGDVHAKIYPAQLIKPSSGGAAHGSRNGHPHVGFDDTTDEHMIASDSLNDYGAAGLDVDIWFCAETAITGNVEFEVSFERIGDGVLDTDVDSFATAQSTGATAVPGTSGYEKKVTISFSDAQIDGLQSWEGFRVKVERKTAVASNALDDAQIRRIIIREP